MITHSARKSHFFSPCLKIKHTIQTPCYTSMRNIKFPYFVNQQAHPQAKHFSSQLKRHVSKNEQNLRLFSTLHQSSLQKESNHLNDTQKEEETLITQRSNSQEKVDVIIGVYEEKDNNNNKLQQILQKVKLENAKWKEGQVRIIYSPDIESSELIPSLSSSNKKTIHRIAFVGLGDRDGNCNHSTADENDTDIDVVNNATNHENKQKESYTLKTNEQFTEMNQINTWSFTQAEKLRKSVMKALIGLKEDNKQETKNVFYLDTMEHSPKYAQQVAEGLKLADYEYKLPPQPPSSISSTHSKDNLNNFSNDKKKTPCSLNIVSKSDSNKEYEHYFRRGNIFAESQIMASKLTEAPGNLKTPTLYAHTIEEYFDPLLQNDKDGKLELKIYDGDWAKSQRMEAFLTVAKGSDEQPRVVEIKYRNNANDKNCVDLMLVGKGITFDSGGISLKPGAGMKEMRGDCGGASSILAAMHGVAKLGLPINVVALAFLCENMPSGRAVKPGDVIYHANKKTIEVDNTDAEGRLILSDALYYGSQMKPKFMIDCATLTGAAVIALGHEVNAVYTSSNSLWKTIETAGCMTNDYAWRMPLMKEHYMPYLKSRMATLNNIGGRAGGSITAAVFLSEFVDMNQVSHWAHVDIAGTAIGKNGEMSGRPTRMLIETADLIASSIQK